jgi:ADP-ribose pyrophosphatase YjhB (NUDIX family)
MKSGKFFNVRVYGLLVTDENELLIAEEFHYDTFMRKLPGGGLQFGEGPRECLIRELREELNIEVSGVEHFYTTDFFITSAFNPEHQVLGIYYRVEVPEGFSSKFRDQYTLPEKNGEEYFRWLPLDSLRWDEFTFPADQAAVKAFLNSKKVL